VGNTVMDFPAFNHFRDHPYIRRDDPMGTTISAAMLPYSPHT